jgi:hypothetical protein
LNGDKGSGSNVLPLEPNHRFAVLVPGSAWAEASPWLAEIATVIAEQAPSVTIVANGDLDTLDDAARSVESGRPVILIAGTGGIADELADALKEGQADDKRIGALVRSGLIQSVETLDGPQALARAVGYILATNDTTGELNARTYQDWLRTTLEDTFRDLGLSKRQERFLRVRWLDQLLFNEERAIRTYKRYTRLRMVALLGGVVIPMIVPLERTSRSPALSWVLFSLSLLVGACLAVDGFYQYANRYLQYRRMAERLKLEGWQFFELSGPYSEYRAHASAYRAFVARVDSLIEDSLEASLALTKKHLSEKQSSEKASS